MSQFEIEVLNVLCEIKKELESIKEIFIKSQTAVNERQKEVEEAIAPIQTVFSKFMNNLNKGK